MQTQSGSFTLQPHIDHVSLYDVSALIVDNGLISTDTQKKLLYIGVSGDPETELAGADTDRDAMITRLTCSTVSMRCGRM